MARLERDIPVILCKLERIFPPSFFDSMEHLPVHLSYEARIAGPVQYRWMYPFERFLGKLKSNVTNKNRVEGSIANAYIMEETSSFCTYYFEDHVLDPVNKVDNIYIIALAKGPFKKVNTYSAYLGNGYRFHTKDHGTNRATINSEICVKGYNYDNDEFDYYGRLLEVVRLEYAGLPMKVTFLFNCEWFDPSPAGTKVHPQYRLVDINHKRRFNRYEPFVISTQVEQVSYCTYPSLKQDKVDWWAVCKIRPRHNVEVIKSALHPSFQEQIVEQHPYVQDNTSQIDMYDQSHVSEIEVVEVVEVDDEEIQIENEFESRDEPTYETEEEENLEDEDSSEEDGEN